MRLQSPRQSERSSARDPVNTIGELIHDVGRLIRNTNKDGRTGVRRLPKIWQNFINKATDRK